MAIFSLFFLFIAVISYIYSESDNNITGGFITGEVIYGEYQYNSLVVNSSISHMQTIPFEREIVSLKINGKFTGNGFAKVYAKSGDAKLLIYELNPSDASVLATGFVVYGDESNGAELNISNNVTNITINADKWKSEENAEGAQETTNESITITEIVDLNNTINLSNIIIEDARGSNLSNTTKVPNETINNSINQDDNFGDIVDGEMVGLVNPNEANAAENISGVAAENGCLETCNILPFFVDEIVFEIEDGFLFVDSFSFASANNEIIQTNNFDNMSLTILTYSNINLEDYFSGTDLFFDMSSSAGYDYEISDNNLKIIAIEAGSWPAKVYAAKDETILESNSFFINIDDVVSEIRVPELTDDLLENTDLRSNSSTNTTNLTETDYVLGNFASNPFVPQKKNTTSPVRLNVPFDISGEINSRIRSNNVKDVRVIIKYKEDAVVAPLEDYLDDIKVQSTSLLSTTNITELVIKIDELQNNISDLSQEIMLINDSISDSHPAEGDLSAVTAEDITSGELNDGLAEKLEVNELKNELSNLIDKKSKLIAQSEILKQNMNDALFAERVISEEEIIIRGFLSDAKINSVVMDLSAIEVLKNNNDIEAIYLDNPLSSLMLESFDIISLQDARNYALANLSPITGEGINICLLDTGFNASTVENEIVGHNFIDDNSDISDDNGHGTNVGYIISNIAPDARLIVGKVLDAEGLGYESILLAGLEYCKAQGADIISLSLGGGGYNGYCDENIVAQYVNELDKSGILIVAATGNDGSEYVKVPACASGALAVGASDKNDTLASPSAINNNTLMLAPGVNIATINKDGIIVNKSGTSMAVPFVSALSALLKEQNALTADETKDVLVHTGVVINNSGRLFSRVDAYNALAGMVTNNLSPAGVNGIGDNGNYESQTTTCNSFYSGSGYRCSSEQNYACMYDSASSMGECGTICGYNDAECCGAYYNGWGFDCYSCNYPYADGWAYTGDSSDSFSMCSPAGYSDGSACSYDYECLSGYCDNDGWGLSDDYRCYTRIDSYGHCNNNNCMDNQDGQCEFDTYSYYQWMMADERSPGSSYDNRISGSNYLGCPAYSSCLIGTWTTCAVYDGDYNEGVCNGLGGTWTTGGGDWNIDSSTGSSWPCTNGGSGQTVVCGDGVTSNGFCCGDDWAENYRTAGSYTACCDSSTDCVDSGRNCRASGYNAGSSTCASGTWKTNDWYDCTSDSQCYSGNCDWTWDGYQQLCHPTASSCIDTISEISHGYERCVGSSYYSTCNNGVWDFGASCDTTADYGFTASNCGWTYQAADSCVTGMTGGCSVPGTSTYDCGELYTTSTSSCNTDGNIAYCSAACGATCTSGQTSDSGVDYCSGGAVYNRINGCAISGQDCYWNDGSAGDTLAQDCDEACGYYADRTTAASCSGSSCVGCPGSCSVDGECDGNAHCDGTCVADLPPGTACDEASDCASGICALDFDSGTSYCTTSTNCINGAGDNQYATGYELCSGNSWYKSCGTNIWGAQQNCDTTADYGYTDANQCGWYVQAADTCSSGATGGCSAPANSNTDCGELSTTSTSSCNTNGNIAYCSAACGATCTSGQTQDTGVDYCSSGAVYNRIEGCAVNVQDCYWNDGSASNTLVQDCDEACGYYIDRAVGASCSGTTCVACPSSCSADGECDANAHCDGTCVVDIGNGNACDEDSDCASGDCNPSPASGSFCTDAAYECARDDGAGIDAGTSTCNVASGNIYLCSAENTISMSTNCATLTSTDNDGGNTPLSAGTTSDYSACTAVAQSTCPSTGYTDTCGSTTALTEYYANAASYASQAYTCAGFEIAASGDPEDDPTDTVNCVAGTGASCSAGAFTTNAGSGGVEQCTGSCGISVNSCNFTEYYAVDSGDACTGLDTCMAKTYDADTNSNTCTACRTINNWNLGGEVASTSCCGDDNGEINVSEKGATDVPAGFNDSITTCCDTATDCSYNDVCVAANAVTGTIPTKAFCGAGTWYGGDTNSTVCSSVVGVVNWAIGGEVASTACCGDDTGEYNNTENTYSSAIAFDNNELACCNIATDCVAGDTCYTGYSSVNVLGQYVGLNVGGNDNKAYCYTGTGGIGNWLDCDQAGFMNTWCANTSGGICGKTYAGGGNNSACQVSQGGTLSGETGAFGEYSAFGACGCCGDDTGENYRTEAFHASMDGAASGSTCCNAATDCSTDTLCVATGNLTIDADVDGDNDYCNAGTWYDCSTTAQCGMYNTCEANNCVPTAITINYVNPTPVDNARSTSSPATINVTVSTTGTGATIDSCILQWNNTNHTMQKIGTGASVTCNITMGTVAGGIYTYRVFANNSVSFTQAGVERTLVHNTPPSISGISLSATSAYNTTNDNITVGFSVSDGQSDTVYNFTDWRRNGTSIAVLNMPFNANVSSTSGGAVKDYSTFGNNGTLATSTSTPSWTAGKIGGAFSFDGGDYMTIPDSNGLSFTDGAGQDKPFSISFWVYPRSSGDQWFINKRGATQASQTEWQVQLYSGNLSFSIFNGGSNAVAMSSTITNPLFLNQWNYLTATYDGSENESGLNIYLNGVKQSTLKVASGAYTGMSATTADVTIGKAGWGSSLYLNAIMDEVKIFNRSLTPEQIYLEYTAGTNNRSTNTLASNETQATDSWNVLVGACDGYECSTSASGSMTINAAPQGVACGMTLSANTTYNLTQNLSVNGAGCLNVTSAMPNVIIDCRGNNITGNYSAGTYGIQVSATNVTIRNCIINNFYSDIYLSGAHNVRIQNVTFGTPVGLLVNATNNGVYTNLTFTNITDKGIYVTNSAGNNSFSDINISANGGHGIYVDGGANNSFDCTGGILNGINSSAVYGLYTNQFNTTIKNCAINNFSTGINFDGADYGSITNITTNITFTYTGSDGMAVYLQNAATYNKLTNNRIYARDVGISLGGSNSNFNQIRDTSATATQEAIKIFSDSTLINNTNATSTAGAGIYVDGAHTTILYSSGSSTSGTGIYVRYKSNLTIMWSRGASLSGAGFVCVGNPDSFILNNSFTSNSSEAVNIDSCNRSILSFSNLTSNSTALYVEDLVNATITNNTISGLASLYQYTSNINITNNKINGSLYLEFRTNNNYVYLNNFSGSSYFINNNNYTNQFNRTNSSGTNQGNSYEGILSRLVYDVNGDGWADIGADLPINATTWNTKWLGLGADYAPATTRTPNWFSATWNTSATSAGSSNASQIKLPLESGGTYNFYVDWGDGTSSVVTSYNDPDAGHNYSTPGIKLINITGTIVGFGFNYAGDRQKILNINRWGDLNVGNSGMYFYGCSNVNFTGTDILNLSGTTTLSNMFHGATKFNGNISGWNTSLVTNMNGMFWGSGFNGNISGWNTGRVTDMALMFAQNSYFNQNINSWDVSNVTTMNSMFWSANAFNQNLSSWNTAKVTNMNSMFSYAGSFNGNISSWNVGNVNDMSYMFMASTFFNQGLSNWNTSNVTAMRQMFYASGMNSNISNWNTAKVNDMYQMFYGASQFNQSIGSWNTANVTTMEGMFHNAAKFNQNISSWDLRNVTSLVNMFNGATTFNQNIGQWNVSKVTNATGMFAGVTLSTANYDALLNGWGSRAEKNGTVFSGGNSRYSANALNGRYNLTNIYNWTITDGGIDMGNYFSATWNTSATSAGSSNASQILLPLESSGTYNFYVDWGDGTSSVVTSYNDPDAGHNYSTPGIKTVNISGTIVGFRFNNGGDRLKIINVTRWGDLRVGNNGGYFAGCTYLNFTGTDNLNLTGTYSLAQMFYEADNFNGNISGWDVSNVTNMQLMFYGANRFNSNINNWNVANVTNMQSMFAYAAVFNQDLNNWNTRNLQNTQEMFSSASTFNGNISNWNTSNLTNPYGMFFSATSFNKPIGNWDMSKVTTLGRMFFMASSFNQPIGTWNISNVQSLERTFYVASSFNQQIDNWDTHNVTDMSYTFYQANVFNQNLSSWNTSKVTNMEFMFDITNFNQNISNWDTRNVRNMRYMFYYSAFNQPIGTWNVSNVTDMSLMFKGNTVFNQNITGWDVRNVRNTVEMFNGSTAFNQNLGSWNVSNLTNATAMFAGVTLSTANYNSLLNGWGSRVEKNGTVFSGGNSRYTAIGVSGRDNLTGLYNWTITDGGIDMGNYFSAVWNTNFISTGSSNASQIALPLESSGTYNFYVDWGDGTGGVVTSSTDPDANHSYNVPGIYTINISGTIVGFRFNNAGDRLKILNITRWGDLRVGNNGDYFEGCAYMNFTGSDNLNLTGTTDFSSMFRNAYNFTGNISGWNVSKVTDFGAMFHTATKFNGDISKWDMSNARNLDSMFLNARAFNQNISGWNTSNVTVMAQMFWNTDVFNQSVGLWNTSNVVDMQSMFRFAIAFNQDLSSWDTHNVTNMANMFYVALSFNRNISAWNTSKVTNMTSMFEGAAAFNQSLSSWDTRNVQNMHEMFWEATAFNQNLGSWNVSNLTNASNMFGGVTLSTANYDALLNGWGSRIEKNGTVFSGGNSKYSASAINGRYNLTNIYNWTITDGGLDNVAPVIASASILPVPANTTDTLRGSCNATDANGGNVTYYYRWYRNGVQNTSGNSASFAQNVSRNVNNLSAGIQSKNEIWIFSCLAFDGTVNSSWMNSTPLNISNTPPSSVTLLYPGNGNDTFTTRAPRFTWTAATDADGDSITYIINVSTSSSFTDSVYSKSGISTTYQDYDLPTEMQLDRTYYWKVQAFDGTTNGSYSQTFNFTLVSFVNIEMFNDEIHFNFIAPGSSNNTLTDNPAPLIIRSLSNTYVNISEMNISKSLWGTQPLGTSYWQIKVRSKADGSFNSGTSKITFFNASNTTNIVDRLNYSSSRNNVSIDMNVTVPTYEGPGEKTSTLSFLAEVTK